MARANGKAETPDIDQIRQNVEIELRRLTRHRLHHEAEGVNAVAKLTKAGILRKGFAALVRSILCGQHTAVVNTLAPDALAILRIVPNRPA